MDDHDLEFTNPEGGAITDDVDVRLIEECQVDTRGHDVPRLVGCGQVIPAGHVVVMDVRFGDMGHREAVLDDELVDAIGVALRIDDHGMETVVDDVAAIPQTRGIDDDDLDGIRLTHAPHPCCSYVIDILS